MGKRRLRELKAENRREEAKQLQAKLKEVEKWKKDHKPARKPDFKHPSEAMKKDAQSFGLDLDDPQVQAALTMLQSQPLPQTKPQSRTFPLWKAAVCIAIVAVLGYFWYWGGWGVAEEEDFY